MPDSGADAPGPAQDGFMAAKMELPGILLFGLYFVLLSIVCVYLLVEVWPGGEETVVIFGRSLELSPDLRLILVAILAGALGAFIHGATSFASYLGNRQLLRSWGWWYLVRPFLGMALGLLFYFAVRGGFLTPKADGREISPYGVAALSGMVGLFSKQAIDKLKEVFENMFPTKGDQGRQDGLEGAENRGGKPGGRREDG